MNVLDKGSIELLQHMGDDNTVVSAARVSYIGESKGLEKDEQLIKYLLENRHTSPFEHVIFTFKIKCPLFVARQWHRHRTWSYNEISRRYTQENIEFYVPDCFRTQSADDTQSSDGMVLNSRHLLETYANELKTLNTLYEFFLKNGVCREQARMILPQSLYTTFYGTVDLHNLFHFLGLRNSPHAQYEIRVYAQAIEALIEPVVPVSFKYWKELKVKKGEK